MQLLTFHGYPSYIWAPFDLILVNSLLSNIFEKIVNLAMAHHIKLFSSFFCIKLGYFTIKYIFILVTNAKAYQQKNGKKSLLVKKKGLLDRIQVFHF